MIGKNDKETAIRTVLEPSWKCIKILQTGVDTKDGRHTTTEYGSPCEGCEG